MENFNYYAIIFAKVYIVFALVTAMTSVFTIIIPTIRYLKAKDPELPVVKYSYICSAVVFIAYFIVAPVILSSVLSGFTDEEYEAIYNNLSEN